MKIRLMMLTVGFETGGTEGQIAELAARYDRSRFDVLVCALKGESEQMRVLSRKGIRSIALDGRGQWDFRLLVRFGKLVLRERPNIIHAFLFRANIAARVVGRLLRVPVVLSSYRGIEVWQESLPRWIDQMTRGWSHAVTCCSHAVRETAIARVGGNPLRYYTIHNGVVYDRFANASPLARLEVGLGAEGPVVGTVCRLDEPVKGLALLLEAMAQLIQWPALRKSQLLIVGDGPARQDLCVIAARLGIGSAVRFVGARHDVERLLPLMDVFVMPSLYEGFGIAIVEAMASGRPVVATSVGGVPEIIQHDETGVLVPPGDATALASAVRSLLIDPEKSRQLGAAGQVRAASKFSMSAAVQQHEELYEALLASRISAVVS